MKDFFAKDKIKYYQRESKKFNMTINEFIIYQNNFKILWEEYGGSKGAKVRLEFIENFLLKSQQKGE